MSTLYLIATPIGHLNDFSKRAIDTLHQVHYIACEHPDHSRKLLSHYGIQTPRRSYHQHNERSMIPTLLKDLKAGKSIALISDAGLPNFSDPGLLLVQAVQEAGLRIVPIPGPCAAQTALMSSGLPTLPSLSYGFLPAKGQERRAILEQLKPCQWTLIFYEAPHRLHATLKDCLDVLGDREACLARELTKQYETIARMPLSTMQQWALDQNKGEIVLMVAGNSMSYTIEDAKILHYLQTLSHLPSKQAIELTSTLLNLRKNKVYNLHKNLKHE